MIVAFVRLLLPAWVPLGHGGIVTCGTWSLQVTNAGPTSTPQRSVAGPQIPLPVR